MIDLHCHLLPGLDDGSPDFATSLAMAKLAVADGITDIACTPHITPGVYDNSSATIRPLIETLVAMLDSEGIGLKLWMGADVHVAPDLVAKLGSGFVPTLAGSRYFLLEPPHQVVPQRLDELVRSLIQAGFVPLITHPERLGWIESHYEMIERMLKYGALVQLTAGSLTGGFGRRAQYWSERLLDKGLVDIVASDAHNITGRQPTLSAAVEVIAGRLGDAAAMELVLHRPAAILRNEELSAHRRPIPPQTTIKRREGTRLASWVKRLRG